MSRLREGLVRAMEELSVRGMKLAAKWAGEQLLGMPPPATSDAEDDLSPVYDGLEDVPSREKPLIRFATLLMSTGEFQRCAHFLRTQIANNAMRSKLGLFLNSYSLYLAGEKLKAQAIAEEVPLDMRINPYLSELYEDLRSMYSENKMDGHLMYIYGIVMRDHMKQCGLKDSTSDVHSSANYSRESPYDILFESVRLYPFNWSCWLEIANGYIASSNSTVGDDANALSVESLAPPSFPDWILETMKLLYGMSQKGNNNYNYLNSDPSSSDNATSKGLNRKDVQDLSCHEIMVAMFAIYVSTEKQRCQEATILFDHIGLPLFPTSQAMLGMLALHYYGIRDFEKARDAFEKIQHINPYRLENLDTFSNILYVMECKAELSHLAHQCVKVDKFRSETCCIVGNYYSLKGQHEKSILHFRRALKVNAKCSSAWTLVGHEYVEMHKTSAAVYSYRMALEMNSADFRAWYGLGQTYEMLHLHQYALYYFRKAASLRPADARMWIAVGSCLSRLGNSSGSREAAWRLKNEAIVAYEKAVNCIDHEGIASRELARLHREMGNNAKAAQFYLHHLNFREHSILGNVGNTEMDIEDSGVVVGEQRDDIDVDQAEGLLYIASYYFDNNDFSAAEKYCMRLLSFRGPEGAEAKSLLRDIRSMAASHQNQNESGASMEEDENPADPSKSFNLMDSSDEIIP